MEHQIQVVVETAKAMWRRRWVGMLAAWIVGIVGAVGLMLIPNRYEASARVYVDTKTVLRPLMKDLAVEPDIDQTVGLLARTLITRPNIELITRSGNFGEEMSTPKKANEFVETLLRNIRLAGSGRDNVFTFSYRDTDPARARLIVEKLVALFLESDSGAKKRDSVSARSFIDDQIKQYEARLSESENRLKEFKLRNIGMADSSGKDYFARMSALTDELGKLTVELRAAEQSRDALRRELNSEANAAAGPSGPIASPELDARIDAQRKQLDELLRRYTDLHPDVVTTKRLIARLEEERQVDIENRRRAAVGRPASTAASADPAVQRSRLALAEAEGNIASMRVRAADMQSRLTQLRASASKVPQMEAELAQLNRDYDVIRRTYENIVARREQASLSEDVDATRSAQFRVIDPPRTEPNPVSPKRTLLAPMIVLAALAAGAAAAFLMVRLVPTFDSPRMLRMAIQRPVLGTVSLRVSTPMLRRRRLDFMAFGSALGGLLVVGSIWVVWVLLHARA